MNSWRTFWGLSRPEKYCFVWAFLLLPVTVLVLWLRWVKVRHWQAILLRLVPGELFCGVLPGQTSLQRAEAAARMVAAAVRRSPIPSKCLPRSLVLWALLRAHGMEPELRFGSRLEDGGLEGHAWVDVAGRILDISGSDATFVPLERPGISRERATR